MEGEDREQGTPQDELTGDADRPDDVEASDDMGYDSAEDAAQQDRDDFSGREEPGGGEGS